MSMKICNDSIGNRTRYLLVCSAVHQATSPPRALMILMQSLKKIKEFPSQCFFKED